MSLRCIDVSKTLFRHHVPAELVRILVKTFFALLCKKARIAVSFYTDRYFLIADFPILLHFTR